MSAAPPLSKAEMAPFVLQQANIGASRCVTHFGLNAGDWEDLRQDLALDCLRRLDQFDPARGDWKPFVVSVVRNHSVKMRQRAAKRGSLVATLFIESEDGLEREASSDSVAPELELKLDVSRVLAQLPTELQKMAALLSLHPPSAVRQRCKLTVSEFERRLRLLRATFAAAGIDTPAACARGGAR